MHARAFDSRRAALSMRAEPQLAQNVQSLCRYCVRWRSPRRPWFPDSGRAVGRSGPIIGRGRLEKGCSFLTGFRFPKTSRLQTCASVHHEEDEPLCIALVTQPAAASTWRTSRTSWISAFIAASTLMCTIGVRHSKYAFTPGGP
jgi:hypothetical protein